MPGFESDDGTWIPRQRAAEPSEHHITEIAEVVENSIREMPYTNDSECLENGISRYVLVWLCISPAFEGSL
jgi:hypothetical protein